MGCAGFTCSKHSLCVLNILYVRRSAPSNHPMGCRCDLSHVPIGCSTCTGKYSLILGIRPPVLGFSPWFVTMVSLLMIGIAAWGKWFGLVSSFQVVGAVIGVGVFLFFVSLAGLIGAMKHHQVLLFFVSFTLLLL
ncbi:Tetraspanin-31 [Liparis tanakae]|uniref:Tetraspanin-31 n=1 Tax=Liparis tanakae TaxID=230148 RepID=A0A4Z2FXT7_9TELE|nr:Tetraspanin-31 [Liparis tanakae]